MRKRREKKLETKLKEMTFGEFAKSRRDPKHCISGGSLKVYGGEIVPTRPYVSILAEINETADRILLAALEKYGLEHAHDEYILVEVSVFWCLRLLKKPAVLAGENKIQYHKSEGMWGEIGACFETLPDCCLSLSISFVAYLTSSASLFWSNWEERGEREEFENGASKSVVTWQRSRPSSLTLILWNSLQVFRILLYSLNPSLFLFWCSTSFEPSFNVPLPSSQLLDWHHRWALRTSVHRRATASEGACWSHRAPAEAEELFEFWETAHKTALFRKKTRAEHSEAPEVCEKRWRWEAEGGKDSDGFVETVHEQKFGG